jgi:hypothetical protein
MQSKTFDTKKTSWLTVLKHWKNVLPFNNFSKRPVQNFQKWRQFSTWLSGDRPLSRRSVAGAGIHCSGQCLSQRRESFSGIYTKIINI